ncbi:hypothetical protein [Peribacillus sp. SCS-37]|uniref:hypothetical protein n=1 Tax=Paraperibacillus esterisolvens TaxID=3115296 RepID=UPI00390585E0
MAAVVIYRNLEAVITKQHLLKWLKVMAILSEKAFLNEHEKWIKADIIDGNLSLPFTFFKLADGCFSFQLEYQRMEDPRVEITDAIELLLLEGDTKGEKHIIRGSDKAVITFSSALPRASEGEVFQLWLEKETQLGKLALLLDSVETEEFKKEEQGIERMRMTVKKHIRLLNKFVL